MKRYLLVIMFFMLSVLVFGQVIWDEPKLISNYDNSVVVDVLASDNSIIYAFVTIKDGKNRLYLNKRDLLGQNVWDNPVFVDSLNYCSSLSIDAKLVRSNDDKIAVFWNQSIHTSGLIEPQPDSVFFQKFNEDGTANTSDKQLLFSGTTLNIVSVKATNANGYYMAYTVNSSQKVRQISETGICSETVHDFLARITNQNNDELAIDAEDNLYVFYQRSQLGSDMDMICMTKINVNQVLINDCIVDSCDSSFLNAFKVIRVNNNRFVIASPKNAIQITCRLTDNQGNYISEQSFINYNDKNNFSLCRAEASTFYFAIPNGPQIDFYLYNNSDSQLHLFRSMGFETLPLVDRIQYLNNNLYYNARLLLIPATDLNHQWFSFITGYVNQSLSVQDQLFQSNYGYCTQLYVNNKFVLIYQNDIHDYNQKLLIKDLPSFVTVFDNNIFDSNIYQNGNSRKSVSFQDKNLVCYNNDQFFRLQNTDGNIEDFNYQQYYDDWVISDIKVTNDNQIVTAYNCYGTSALFEGYSGISISRENGFSQYLIYNVYQNGVFIEKDEEAVWAILQGAINAEDVVTDLRNVHLAKISAAGMNIYNNIYTADRILGLKGRYFLFTNNNQTRIQKFDESGQIAVDWDEEGTLLRNNRIDLATSFNVKETEMGTIVIWSNGHTDNDKVYFQLLNSQTGETLFNQPFEIENESGNPGFSNHSDLKIEFITDSKFVISYLDGNSYAKCKAFQITDNNLTQLWEKSFNWDHITCFDMKIIGEKIVFSGIVASYPINRLFVKTLSFDGIYDQFNAWLQVAEFTAYVVNKVEIVPSGDDHAFINYDINGYALYFQYLDLTQFVGTDDTETVAYSLNKSRNYPNPFNPTTNIEFYLPKEQKAEVSIYNSKGQKVKTLADGILRCGRNSIVWDGKDNTGKNSASGIYFYRIKTSDNQVVKKMTLIK